MIKNGRLWIAERNKNEKGQRKRTQRMKIAREIEEGRAERCNN
jgi:hypothetical protein